MNPVRVAGTEDELSVLVARALLEAAEETLRAQDRFSLVLAGGNTPRRLYERMALPPFQGLFPWARMDFFWGDERFVPSHHPENNALMARQAMLEKLSLPGSSIHPMPTHLSTPEQAARDYEETLRRYFSGRPPRFDAVLLGLGEDGHVASLFPGSPILNETEKWVSAVHGCPKPPPDRVTLTLPTLNNARRIFFLVSGAGKKDILEKTLHKPALALPAQRVQPADGSLIWWADRAAAPGFLEANPRIS